MPGTDNQMSSDQLVTARNAMNLRCEALAAALDVDARTYREWENGKVIPQTIAFAVLYMIEHPEARPLVNIEDIASHSGAEIMADLWSSRGLYDGKEWGPWRFNGQSMTIDYNSRITLLDRDGNGNDVMGRTEDYYIDLDRSLTAEDVLDWLGQINGKDWGPAQLGYLVEAFDEIVGFQGKLAHGEGYATSNDLFNELRRRMGISGEA